MNIENFSSKDIENLTLLLIYLNSHDENKKREFGDKPALRSQKRYNFNILDKLTKSGFIRRDSKEKSVYLTEDGILAAKNIASRLSVLPEILGDRVLIDGEEKGITVEYKDIKHACAHTVDGGLLISIPSKYSEQQKQETIIWFKQRFERKQKVKGRFIESYREFKDGDILDLGNKKYNIKIDFEDKQGSSAKLVKDTIHLKIASGLSDENKKIHAYDLIRRIVSRQKAHFLRHKISELNKTHFNVQFNDVKWKKQSSRWGSCSEDGNINISYKLLFAPQDVLEYVCIHELAHIIEQNHSENFWKLVEKAMPNYKEKEEWLKTEGHTCY